MTRLPRDLDATHLIHALRRLGYEPTRQTGSHIRLTTLEGGRHSVTVPNHRPMRIGTLNKILRDLEQHHGLERSTLLDRLFG